VSGVKGCGMGKCGWTYVDDDFEDDQGQHGDFFHANDADALVVDVGDAAGRC
jgi:hypothetical protein